MRVREIGIPLYLLYYDTCDNLTTEMKNVEKESFQYVALFRPTCEFPVVNYEVKN